MLTACWTQSRRRWATDMTALRHSVFEFRLPDVGEGLEEAEIVEWKVSVGQQIAVNQVVVEIETAKSLVELPSPFAGTVLELLSSVDKPYSSERRSSESDWMSPGRPTAKLSN